MKKIIFLFIIVICTLKIQAQENEVTSYYFIRHAEKIRHDKTNKNPDLTEKGLRRAQNWNTVFGNIDFDIIYSTDYNRTVQTAAPTAKSKGLEIQIYNPRELFSEEFQLDTNGKTVLVVGHSNTIPLFVNKVLGTEKYSKIDDTNNSNLYIITIANKKKTDILLIIEH